MAEGITGSGWGSTAPPGNRNGEESFSAFPATREAKENSATSLTWDFPVVQTEATALRIGAGIKRADWSDDSLLLDDDRLVVVGEQGELGALLRADLAITINKPLFLLLGVEPVYWPGIDLGETRLRIGLRMGPHGPR